MITISISMIRELVTARGIPEVVIILESSRKTIYTDVYSVRKDITELLNKIFLSLTIFFSSLLPRGSKKPFCNSPFSLTHNSPHHLVSKLVTGNDGGRIYQASEGFG